MIVASARALFDRAGGDDSRALPFRRTPLAGPPIGSLDDDAGSERPACVAKRSGGKNFRWRASVLALPCGERGEEFGKEVRSSIAVAEDRHDMFGAAGSIAAAVCFVRVPDHKFLFVRERQFAARSSAARGLS